MKKINWKLVLVVFSVVVVSAVFAFVVWANNASPASDVALQAMRSDSQVVVSEENGWVIFLPANEPRPETGFIFYPGGRVDYRAYSPVLRMIAKQGYFVVLVPAPLNLAFFDVNISALVVDEYPEIQNWAVGGHSLGGVAASIYAASHADVKGVVFWASYPADDALKFMEIKVVSIFGTQDGLATEDKLDQSRALLPADAQFVAIEGGNHAQFGSYGLQAGDNEAAISSEDQWMQISSATVGFLKTLSQ